MSKRTILIFILIGYICYLKIDTLKSIARRFNENQKQEMPNEITRIKPNMILTGDEDMINNLIKLDIYHKLVNVRVENLLYRKEIYLYPSEYFYILENNNSFLKTNSKVTFNIEKGKMYELNIKHKFGMDQSKIIITDNYEEEEI